MAQTQVLRKALLTKNMVIGSQLHQDCGNQVGKKPKK
jgi:hypothetical protein